MRLFLLAFALAALPLATSAQEAPSRDQMVEVISTVFSQMGCMLDISDEAGSELIFATAIAEQIGSTPEVVLDREEGGMYHMVGDALEVMADDGTLVFDEQMTTLTMPECEPVESTDQ